MVLNVKAEQWGDKGRFWSACARCNTHWEGNRGRGSVNKPDRKRNTEGHTNKKEVTRVQSIKSECGHEELSSFTLLFLHSSYLNSSHNTAYIHAKTELIIISLSNSTFKALPLYTTHTYSIGITSSIHYLVFPVIAEQLSKKIDPKDDQRQSGGQKQFTRATCKHFTHLKCLIFLFHIAQTNILIILVKCIFLTCQSIRLVF